MKHESQMKLQSDSIYISEFETKVDLEREVPYEALTMSVIDLCRTEGFNVHRSKNFTSYEEIETKILTSRCLIAIVDKYWTSSTWKQQELLYAMGQFVDPVSNVITHGKPTPRIIVPNLDVDKSFNARHTDLIIRLEELPNFLKQLNEQ